MSREAAEKALAELALAAQVVQYPAFTIGKVVSITADSAATVQTITITEDGSDEELGPIPFLGDVALLSVGDQVLLANIHHSPSRQLVAIGRIGSIPSAAAVELMYPFEGSETLRYVLEDGSFEEITAGSGANTISGDFGANQAAMPACPRGFRMSDGARVVVWDARATATTGGGSINGTVGFKTGAGTGLQWAVRDPGGSWGSVGDEGDQGAQSSFKSTRKGDVIYLLGSYSGTYLSTAYRGTRLWRLAYSGGTVSASSVDLHTPVLAGQGSEVFGIAYDSANDLVHAWWEGRRAALSGDHYWLTAHDPTDLSVSYAASDSDDYRVEPQLTESRWYCDLVANGSQLFGISGGNSSELVVSLFTAGSSAYSGFGAETFNTPAEGTYLDGNEYHGIWWDGKLWILVDEYDRPYYVVREAANTYSNAWLADDWGADPGWGSVAVGVMQNGDLYAAWRWEDPGDNHAEIRARILPVGSSTWGDTITIDTNTTSGIGFPAPVVG